MRAKEFTKQGLTEGFEEKAQEYKSYLLKTLPQLMLFLKGVRGAPSEKQMLDAIDVAYNVMKRTGDVKQAAKAKKEFLARITDQQGVAEGSLKEFSGNPVDYEQDNEGPDDAWIQRKARLILDYVKKQPGMDLIKDIKIGYSFRTNTFQITGKNKNFNQTYEWRYVYHPGDKEKGIKPRWVPHDSMTTDRPYPPDQFTQVVFDEEIREQGVAEDTVDEMALSTYKTMGDFSKPGPFTGADKKLVPHPKNIEKATRFFEQTPFDFRLFFSHLKGTGKYSEHGPMPPEQVKQVFGQDAEEIINGSEDAITVVYVGNKGDAKVMLTPWMMAHRFGHAINAGVRNKNWTAWGEAEKYFFQTVNSFLEEHYGKVPATKTAVRNILYQLEPEYNALFNAIGTQRSSKSGQIRRPYEFLYELFAQYLGTGKVTLNPLPTNLTYGRRVFGNPTKYMNIKPEYRDEGERQQAADSLAYTMELLFNDVLSDSVGKIFVM